jgi:APA family basic amino acid/polyamine antiporter
MSQSKNQLIRGLNLTDSTSLVIGKVIGTGVFLKAAVMMQYVHTPTMMLAAWAAAGLLSLAGALTYAELGAMYPKAGGEYVYLRAAYGDATAFLYGWMQVAVGQTGIIAALGIAAATFMSAFLHVNAVWLSHTFNILGKPIDWQFGPKQVIAIGLILAFSAINCAGVAMGGKTQSLLTAAKLLAVVIIVGGVFFLSNGGSWTHFSSSFDYRLSSGFGSFAAAMLAAMFAYNGWGNLPMAAGEVKNPGRNIPLALIGGMLVVVTVYILVNLSYVYLLPATEIARSSSTAFPTLQPVATKVVGTFLGASGEKIISVIFVISAIGSLNAGILTAARIPYAMARDGLFFSKVAELSNKSRVPMLAIIIQGIWASVLALSGTFDQLTDFAVFALWLFFALTTVSVFVLRKKASNLERPYKTLGYPILPFAFIAVAAWLVINTLITNPRGSGAGLTLIAMGLPIYFYFRSKRRSVVTNSEL